MNGHEKRDMVRDPHTKKAPVYQPDVVEELGRLSFEELAIIVDDIQQTQVQKNVRAGAGPGVHTSGLGTAAYSIVLDMAMTRREASEKFSRGGELFFTKEGLRWATPEPAARHCASRLRGGTCLDICCGQGGQALFLAMECERVVAFDIDPLNCLIARSNAKALGIENLEVHQLDCLSSEAVGLAEKCIHVFSDPARPPGSHERTLEELRPDPRQVLMAYGKTAEGFCFELPPYINIERITFPHEAEYVSLDGRLNRLNIYTGRLAKQTLSAVVLPGGESISGPKTTPPEGGDGVPFPERYMFELDHTVVRAGLVGVLMGALGHEARYLELDDRRSVILSNGELSSPFFTGRYHILGFSPDPHSVANTLKEQGAGKVTLRYKVDPESYWDERARLEKGLTGHVWVHLFMKGSYILAERMEGA